MIHWQFYATNWSASSPSIAGHSPLRRYSGRIQAVSRCQLVGFSCSIQSVFRHCTGCAQAPLSLLRRDSITTGVLALLRHVLRLCAECIAHVIRKLAGTFLHPGNGNFSKNRMQFVDKLEKKQCFRIFNRSSCSFKTTYIVF